MGDVELQCSSCGTLARRIGATHLGIACCVGTQREAGAAQQIFEANGFRVSSVACKVGSIPKEEIGLTDAEKIYAGELEVLCNPTAQAEVPVTVLVAKHQVTGHNPAAALYTSRSYYKKLREPPA